MELKACFKQSEVGEIPEEWEVPILRKYLQQDATYGVVTAGSFLRSGVPMIRGGDIKDGSIGEDQPFISDEKSREYSRTVLRGGDVVIALVGYPGESAVVPERLVGANISRAVGLLRPTEALLPSYLACYLNSPAGRKEFLRPSAGSAQIVVNLGALNKLVIPVPAPAEQTAIATALSDVDALLAAQDALIAKKRAIKQGAMQELLTGKRRLPGFSGEWEVKRLGKHLEFLSNGANSRAELTNDGRVRYLHYGDIHGANGVFLDPTTTEMPFLPEEKATRLDRLRNGDLIFADASEDIDGVGRSVEIKNVDGLEVVSGMHTIAARFDKAILADGFKAYLQEIPAFHRHLRQLASGTKVYATNMSHIASAELTLPEANEQIAISKVLLDMDAEIMSLEAQRAKTAQLKKGMMQALLTGRIRLI
ncbi:MAG: restriction endonuclease subunit S [Thermomonas sp.]|uniref:restriction endonuclease subunit S n=1 Tax=Thermomonas sp. TaxID=1971895 RepID=UPI001DB29242|nr:restriction endonuclease subunit S [Thermomonas sp.]MBZ0086868.1 restriction endonuclease subunit S [Thermomonas sp.]